MCFVESHILNLLMWIDMWIDLTPPQFSSSWLRSSIGRNIYQSRVVYTTILLYVTKIDPEESQHKDIVERNH